MTERLRMMSATAEGKHFALSSIFDSCCVVKLANAFFSFFLLSSFVVQDLPGCLHCLCSQAMILL
jgi:hypothetical protein